MKTGGWRPQGAIAATLLVVAQWAAMPAFAQTVSTSAAAPAMSATPAASAAPERASDDDRWRRFVGATGVVSYVDKQSVQPQVEAQAGTPTVHFKLLRNVLPDFTIKTSDGQPIRSSVKQVVLDCAQRLRRRSTARVTPVANRCTRSAMAKTRKAAHFARAACSTGLRGVSVQCTRTDTRKHRGSVDALPQTCASSSRPRA